MRRQRRRIVVALVIVALGILGAIGYLLYSSMNPVVVSLDPRNGYVRVHSSDRAGGAVAIELSALGLKPGDTVRIQCVGTFYNGKVETTNLAGVFSTDAVLLPSDRPMRVSGAVDAGDDHVSGSTYYGDEPTDIPQDFAIDDVTLRIPPDAAYLFVAPPDTLFRDNHDRDGDFGVRITKLPFSWWGALLPKP